MLLSEVVDGGFLSVSVQSQSQKTIQKSKNGAVVAA